MKLPHVAAIAAYELTGSARSIDGAFAPVGVAVPLHPAALVARAPLELAGGTDAEDVHGLPEPAFAAWVGRISQSVCSDRGEAMACGQKWRIAERGRRKV